MSVHDLFLEVRKLPDGRTQARRRDGRPLTNEDRQRVRQLVDSLPGITADDVLRVFGGGRILTPEEAKVLAAVEGLPQ